jgi:hypothetical protein
MIGVRSWLVPWTSRAGTIDFSPALAALVSPVQNSIFHTTATWAGRRAGPPVSLSLILPSLQNLAIPKMLRFPFQPLGYERSNICKKTSLFNGVGK